MFINKQYNIFMLLWLKAGRLDKIINIANSSLELRKLASKYEYSNRLVLFVRGY